MTMPIHTMLAFDSASMRFEEWNGHLRVENTNLTKANVCEYYGFEISNYQKYGLNARQRYRFYRSPDALQQALPSFKERPILYVHKAADADHLDNSKVIGTTGSDPQFDPPYVQCSITIWDGDYIQAIKDNRQKELSASYAFVPLMTPGNVNGEPYDGIMTHIYVDHIALVEEGRAGHDVRVSDERLLNSMQHQQILNPLGLRVRDALCTLLNQGVTNDAMGDALSQSIQTANGVSKMGFIPIMVALCNQSEWISDDQLDAINACLQDILSNPALSDLRDEDPLYTLNDPLPLQASVDPALSSQASDAPSQGDPSRSPKAQPKTRQQDKLPAADGAIAEDSISIEKRAEARVLARLRGIEEARLLIRPLVGNDWAMACDSAEEILRSSLESALGQAVPDDVGIEGLKFMVKQLLNQKQPHARVGDRQSYRQNDFERIGSTRLRRI
ncbi:hypothetical protein COMNV_01352 [Commensalibacter sp. Nvir]|uniref:DUF2213 domain-containing protein n=1 Tax=Commensalibacter sp. Nvir TaxID=3069817 RepID=UPI002D2A90CB|nr:hypothetical protein COMNV_01352 [Commensalibacter sp. Nvir]